MPGLGQKTYMQSQAVLPDKADTSNYTSLNLKSPLKYGGLNNQSNGGDYNGNELTTNASQKNKYDLDNVKYKLNDRRYQNQTVTLKAPT